MLGALGSRDKAIVSWPGNTITPLYMFASDGAKGMGRTGKDAALTGGSIRLTVVASQSGALPPASPPVYDIATPNAPVLLSNRARAGVNVSMRVLQGDSGARKSGEGVLIGLSATAAVHISASIDWSAAPRAADSGTALLSAEGVGLLCVTGATSTAVPRAKSGHLGAGGHGFRAGVMPASAKLPADAPAWASTYGTALNFPGQDGFVGKTASTVSYVLSSGTAAKQPVYVAVGLADPGYGAHYDKARPVTTVAVECNGATTTLKLPLFRGGEAVYYLPATTDDKGEVLCSAPFLSAIWIYAKETVARATAPALTHACDDSGFDAKGGQCLRLRPCNASVPGQQFKRAACPTLHGPASSPPRGTECLSVRTAAGLRFLNAELWGSCQAPSPGPLIAYREFVYPCECGGRNQFWRFPPDGSVRLNISGACLTYDAERALASLGPCASPLPSPSSSLSSPSR